MRKHKGYWRKRRDQDTYENAKFLFFTEKTPTPVELYLVGDSKRHTLHERTQGTYFQRIWQFLLTIREEISGWEFADFLNVKLIHPLHFQTCKTSSAS